VLLRTDRLLLRPFELRDADDVWAYRRLPEVVRHMLVEARDRDGAAVGVRRMMAETEIGPDGGVVTFAVVLPERDTVIGEVSLVVRSAVHRCGEIGYVFHPDHQGKGLASEASNELLRLGFEDLGLRRVYGMCSAQNAASARLMERLGMRREAHFIGSRWAKGTWRDELVYAILADEWRLRRSRLRRSR
jgi:RimJ/RimL family protein N-acetyltransferase